MAYGDNPFNSPQGQKIVKDIFNLMFIEPEGQPRLIEEKNKSRQVENYRSNIVNIVIFYDLIISLFISHCIRIGEKK